MVFELVKNNSVANQYLAEIRDIKIQTDRMRFRRNLERLGEILAYEMSKQLEYKEVRVKTPLGVAGMTTMKEPPILIPILRAAVPFYQGVLNIFDKADSGFAGIWRVEANNNTAPETEMNYMATPSMEGKIVVVIDPMLATGKSLVMTIKRLLKHGRPKGLHVLSVIAARPGLEHLRKNVEIPVSVWIGAIDEKLNKQSYIVPGLGDAGDLSFGPKL